MKLAVALLMLVFSTTVALAQPAWKRDGRERQMKQEERERMREDVREAYRDRRERGERPRQMTPEEREKLRRDIENANRELRRK